MGSESVMAQNMRRGSVEREQMAAACTRLQFIQWEARLQLA